MYNAAFNIRWELNVFRQMMLRKVTISKQTCRSTWVGVLSMFNQWLVQSSCCAEVEELQQRYFLADEPCIKSVIAVVLVCSGWNAFSCCSASGAADASNSNYWCLSSGAGRSAWGTAWQGQHPGWCYKPRGNEENHQKLHWHKVPQKMVCLSANCLFKSGRDDQIESLKFSTLMS